MLSAKSHSIGVKKEIDFQQIKGTSANLYDMLCLPDVTAPEFDKQQAQCQVQSPFDRLQKVVQPSHF